MAASSSEIDSPALQGDLHTAEIIVAVGRGVKDFETLSLVVKFAEVVHGQIAATRGAVAAGLLPREREIGLSGTRVFPRLYIGCGVAGANFHTIGMEHAETIIGVNLDPKARIFEMADVSVLDDVRTCVSKILQSLQCSTNPLTADRLVELFEDYQQTARSNV